MQYSILKDDKPAEKEEKEKTKEEVKKPDEDKPSEETETATVRAKLYIDGPDEAEVYFDGSYKGIVPCAFIKVAGTHVITLRQDGHKTKHYTITLSADEDETYSFAELEELDENNVHINIFGEYDMLPKASVDAINKMVGRLADNDGLVFNIALNYGGRDEILRAVRKIAEEAREGSLDPADLGEDSISERLYTGGMPDPDLIIRTSGELRLSNFLIWQCAYSEFYFTETLWPDFDETAYEEALRAFSHRKRNFGGR